VTSNMHCPREELDYGSTPRGKSLRLHYRYELRSTSFGFRFHELRQFTLSISVGHGAHPTHVMNVYVATSQSGYTLVTLLRIVTPYRDSVDGTRDLVKYPKLVTW
jgi:hypothetical protein